MLGSVFGLTLDQDITADSLFDDQFVVMVGAEINSEVEAQAEGESREGETDR